MKKRERLVYLQSSKVEQALKLHKCLGNSAVELKQVYHLVACPGGNGGSGGLITTRSLFDPTDSMAVRPPGKQGNSCMLMVTAHNPDVTTHAAGLGNYLASLQIPPRSHVTTSGC